MHDQDHDGGSDEQTGPTLGRCIILATPGGNEAESLAHYLSGHGVEAIAANNEVTAPYDCECAVMRINELASNWIDWWEHCDQALYGLPLFNKDGSYCDDGE